MLLAPDSTSIHLIPTPDTLFTLFSWHRPVSTLSLLAFTYPDSCLAYSPYPGSAQHSNYHAYTGFTYPGSAQYSPYVGCWFLTPSSIHLSHATANHATDTATTATTIATMLLLPLSSLLLFRLMEGHCHDNPWFHQSLILRGFRLPLSTSHSFSKVALTISIKRGC